MHDTLLRPTLRSILATVLLLGVAGAAWADQFDEGFDVELDPENFTVTAPEGFDVAVSDGKVVLSKDEGIGNGFAVVSTTFTVKGDFDFTVEAARIVATSGAAIGLGTTHIGTFSGGTNIFFQNVTNMNSNIFVDPVHATQIAAVPGNPLTLRIRRTGGHMVHEYDSGSGFVTFHEATNQSLAGPVRVIVFLGEEFGNTGPISASFDNLSLEGEAFSPPCGNGVVEEGESCDDDDPAWMEGEFCTASCLILLCGDPDDSGKITAVDALFALRTSVGTRTCDACVCDVDSSGGGSPTSVGDALRILRFAVGVPVELVCIPCV